MKGDDLWVGGLGKEWTTQDGKVLNTHPMFVKKINRWVYYSILAILTLIIYIRHFQQYNDRFIRFQSQNGCFFYLFHLKTQVSNVE